MAGQYTAPSIVKQDRSALIRMDRVILASGLDLCVL